RAQSRIRTAFVHASLQPSQGLFVATLVLQHLRDAQNPVRAVGTVLEHRQPRIRAADRAGDTLAPRSEGGAGVVVPARTGGQRLPPLLDEVAVGGQALLAEHVGAALRGAEEDLVVAREAAADESRGEVLGFGLRGPAGPEVSLLD